ncbi:MAG: hypothetical protein R2745_22420 [Vicinamibacterales bacterium]
MPPWMAGVLALAFSMLAPAMSHAQPATTRVSMGAGGEGDAAATSVVLSADGRWAAFASWADTLVPNDTNDAQDIFVHDRTTGATTRVSVGPGGLQADLSSYGPAISADGRWVAFESLAGNLVLDDTNGETDVFVHDRLTGTTSRVSIGSGGAEHGSASFAPAISADGRWVAFHSDAPFAASDTNGEADVYVHDRQTGLTARVSLGPGGAQGNAASVTPAISADGRWVAFQSLASNLVAGDTNAVADVFVHDRQTGATARVSVASGGGQAAGASTSPALSADGRWVAFASLAGNLVFDDTNGETDVFVHDRASGGTARVSLGAAGAQANGSSSAPALSADGRRVAFASLAANLVAGDTNGVADVFVVDRQAATTTRASVASDGTEGNGASAGASIDALGGVVAFSSAASTLVANDTNGVEDAFVRDDGGSPCALTTVPAVLPLTAAAGAGSVLVLAPAGCAWTAASADPSWLVVTGGANGTGVGVVGVAVAQNTGPSRTGHLTIGGQAVVVTQPDAATPLAPTALAIREIAGHVVTLRWTMPPGGPAPTGFLLEGGLLPGEVLASVATASPAWTFTMTAPSGSFYARVRALNGALPGPASNEIPIHVNVPLAPSPPRDLLGLVAGSTLSLAWTNTFDGGTPTSIVVEVTGTTVASATLALGDTLSLPGVPPGTYRIAVRTSNAAGMSERSSTLTLSVPAACAGPPAVPAQVFASAAGGVVSVDWAPGLEGPAPTAYVIVVTGTWVGALATPARALRGPAPPGAYDLRVMALNACGASAASPPVTLAVP